jgi:hypothetical protein
MSYAKTSPPRRFMIAMACNPATATPKTMTFAALVVPAAVESIGTYFPREFAPIRAHL